MVNQQHTIWILKDSNILKNNICKTDEKEVTNEMREGLGFLLGSPCSYSSHGAASLAAAPLNQ